MLDQITLYIKTCREQGFADDQIEAELLKTGYDATTIAEAFSALSADMTESAAEPVMTTSESNPSRIRSLVIVVGVVVSILVLGTVSWLYGGTLLQKLSFWQSAPYATDGELTLGIIRSFTELPHAPMTTRTSLAIELQPQEPNETVQVWSDLADAGEFMDQSGSGFLPSEGYMRLNVDSKVDVRDLEQPLVDIEATMDMLFEPFIAKVAGATRVVDNKLYLRVDDVPAMFEPMYRELITAPLGTWLLVGTLDELKSGTNSGLTPLVPGLLLQNTSVATDELAQLQPVFELFSSLPSRSAAQAAAVYTEGVTFFDDVNQAEVYALLERYPILNTTAPVERVQTESGPMYRYTVEFNGQNMYRLVEAIPSTITDPIRRAEVEASLADVLTDLSDTSSFELLKQYFTIYLDFKSSGNLAGVLVESQLTDHPDSPSKLVIKLHSQIDSTEAFDLKPPSPVHPGSLFEIFSERQRQQEEQMQQTRTQMQLNNLRAQAELYYNDNNFSYAGVCGHFTSIVYMPLTDQGCADTAQAYQTHAALKAGYHCVDSTGFAGEVAIAPTGLTCR